MFGEAVGRVVALWRFDMAARVIRVATVGVGGARSVARRVVPAQTTWHRGVCAAAGSVAEPLHAAVQWSPSRQHLGVRWMSADSGDSVVTQPAQKRRRLPTWFIKMVGYSSKSAKRIRASDAMFRACYEQATQQCAFDELKLERNFRSEQAMLMLHIWMCHNKFTDEGVFYGGGKEFQETLFERVWEDAMRGIRHEMVPEISVNKVLRELQSQSYGAMMAYDAALEKEDSDKELEGALERNVFAGAAVPGESFTKLADYLMRENAAVLELPLDVFETGYIPFGEAIGESYDERIARHNSLADGEWRQAMTEAGALYYYHTTSMATRWRMPEGETVCNARPLMA